MIPLERIDTVFLDVGNTLVSHDFDAIARVLAEEGLPCEPDQLRRAEAAARPALSRWLEQGRSTEGRGTLEVYLTLALQRVPDLELDAGALPARVEAVVPRLKQEGLLFCRALPGVDRALADLAAAGPRLVAVSNSDGSVERLLETLGLRASLEGVVDSALVGFEKPDPAIFRHALERFDCRPESTLHVGDLHAVDVLGARSAGLEAALVDPFGDWPETDCLRVRDVAELAELVRRAREAARR